jgi:integrase
MRATRTSYEGPIGGPAKSAVTSIGWTLRLRRQSCATLSARRCGTRCGATPRSVGQSPRTGALSILKTALRFAVDAGYLDISPVDRLPSELVGGVESSRDRVLTDEELRRLWQARSAHMPLLRFLILTGQRIGEAQRARSSHVHDDRWHIPKEHSKNHRAHWVALPRQALALLRGRILPARSSSGRPRTPVYRRGSAAGASASGSRRLSGRTTCAARAPRGSTRSGCCRTSRRKS